MINVLVKINEWISQKEYCKHGKTMGKGVRMPYSPKAIANTFLDIAKEHNDRICPMKMQKMVFFSHGWHLAFKNSPLITEKVQAWTYGPVIESLYHDLKEFGRDPITSPIMDVEIDQSVKPIRIKVVIPKVEDDDVYVKTLLNRIWEIYGEFSDIKLSNMTHLLDTPWYKAKSNKETIISNDDIKEYFSKLRKSSN